MDFFKDNAWLYFILATLVAPMFLHFVKNNLDLHQREKLKVDKANLLKEVLRGDELKSGSMLFKCMGLQSIYGYRYSPKEIKAILKSEDSNYMFQFYKKYNKALSLEGGRVRIKEDFILNKSIFGIKYSKYSLKKVCMYFLFSVLAYFSIFLPDFFGFYSLNDMGLYWLVGAISLSCIFVCFSLLNMVLGLRYESVEKEFDKLN